MPAWKAARNVFYFFAHIIVLGPSWKTSSALYVQNAAIGRQQRKRSLQAIQENAVIIITTNPKFFLTVDFLRVCSWLDSMTHQGAIWLWPEIAHLVSSVNHVRPTIPPLVCCVAAAGPVISTTDWLTRRPPFPFSSSFQMFGFIWWL